MYSSSGVAKERQRLLHVTPVCIVHMYESPDMMHCTKYTTGECVLRQSTK